MRMPSGALAAPPRLSLPPLPFVDPCPCRLLVKTLRAARQSARRPAAAAVHRLSFSASFRGETPPPRCFWTGEFAVPHVDVVDDFCQRHIARRWHELERGVRVNLAENQPDTSDAVDLDPRARRPGSALPLLNGRRRGVRHGRLQTRTQAAHKPRRELTPRRAEEVDAADLVQLALQPCGVGQVGQVVVARIKQLNRLDCRSLTVLPRAAMRRPTAGRRSRVLPPRHGAREVARRCCRSRRRTCRRRSGTRGRTTPPSSRRSASCRR